MELRVKQNSRWREAKPARDFWGALSSQITSNSSEWSAGSACDTPANEESDEWLIKWKNDEP